MIKVQLEDQLENKAEGEVRIAQALLAVASLIAGCRDHGDYLEFHELELDVSFTIISSRHLRIGTVVIPGHADTPEGINMMYTFSGVEDDKDDRLFKALFALAVSAMTEMPERCEPQVTIELAKLGALLAV